MNQRHSVRARMRHVAGAAAIALVLTAAACGEDEDAVGPVDDAGLPAVVKIPAIIETTGVSGHFGKSTIEGIKLAMKEINESDFLGSTDLELVAEDTTGDVQTAASLATEAIANRDYPVIIGPISSPQSLAVAPIAQKQEATVVFTQSGSEGVVLGEYTIRATAPQNSYYYKVAEHLRDQGVTRLSIIYNAAFGTQAGLAQDTLPQLADEYGFEIVASAAVQAETADMTGAVSRALGKDPDAVALLNVGPQIPSSVSRLRQAGFDGPIVAHVGAAGGNLTPAGEDAAGVIWATGFSALQQGESSQKFVAAFEAEYGQKPTNFSAEGYDATWMIARALKEADSIDRDEVHASLLEVIKAGFTGAHGDITFEGYDMRVPGVLVEWTGTEERIFE